MTIEYGILFISKVIVDDIERVISLDIGNNLVEKDLYSLYDQNLTNLVYLLSKDAILNVLWYLYLIIK